MSKRLSGEMEINEAELPLSARVVRRAAYFGRDDATLFGWFHLSRHKPMHSRGVVICPPIGYEYVHSHRSLRHLADHLASLGFATLRFDYHGSGDSDGLNQDPQRVQAWLESVRQAIVTLKQHTGCTHISLLGLRLGATFAGMVAGEQDMDALVLWEPCVQGRRFVRELKALHLTATAHTGEALGETADIESAGFVITRETADELGKLNLNNITPRAGRILICQRDDTPADPGLQEAWSSHGKTVERISYPGYADMMAETHFTVVPEAAIQQIGNWLNTPAPQSTQATDKSVESLAQCDNASIRFHQYIHDDKSHLPDLTINERILQFGEKRALFGIVSQPVGDDWKRYPTIILLNSGSVHHIGPHRLYVFLARQFAQMGIRTLRLDMAGIGDSFIDDSDKENHPYTPTATHDARAAITALRQAQPDGRFVLMGLCSGAYASFHAGIEIKDEAISECILINPLTFYWKEGMSLAIPSEAHYRQWNDYMVSMRKWDKWLKLLRGGVSIKEIIRTIMERIQILVAVQLKNLKKILLPKPVEISSQRDLADDLQTIAEQARHISFVFSENDPGYNLLMTNAKNTVKRLQRQNKLSIQIISHADHTFSKNAARQVVMQRLALLAQQRILAGSGVQSG